jgi:hypothetical protein
MGNDVLEPLFGNGNNLPTPTTSEERELNEEASQLAQQTQPLGPPALPSPVIKPLIVALPPQQEMRDSKGVLTGEARAALVKLAGALVTACAKDVADLGPRQGEPLMGLWYAKCDDVEDGAWGAVVGKYERETVGLGSGPMVLGSYWTDAGFEHYLYGEMRADADGDAVGIGYGTYGTYLGEFTDKTRPFSGKARLISGGKDGYCSTTTLSQTRSTNPIPDKYREAMKRMGQCYKQALTLASPITAAYLMGLTNSSSKQVTERLDIY